MSAGKNIAAVALVAMGIGAGAGQAATSHPHAVTEDHSPRVCFRASHWGPAPEAQRPCVRITNVEEDGSFGYSVSDADGTVRYSSGIGALDR